MPSRSSRRAARTSRCSTAANNANNPNLDPTEGREPRARREVGIPRWRAGRHRRHLRQHEQERADARIATRSHRLRAARRARGEGHRARHRRQAHRQLGAVSAGVAKMDTEIVQGLANQHGLQINWSPELTFTSWTTYHTPFGLSIGGGARYVDSVIRPVTHQRRAAAGEPDQHARRARLLGGRRHARLRRSTRRSRCSSTATTSPTRSTSPR